MLGSLAGNALFPTQLPGQSGPRIQDNQTTTSVVGSPVPILFGTASLSGTYMWLDKIFTHTNTDTVGGKGGPTQTNTTYSYTQSVAVGLCEGPIGGISRIWENGTLVYDIRPQLPFETDVNYTNRLTVAAVYSETFTLHLGGEDQTPDATIESVQGMGNVPGFRGLAYIVYPNRKLLDTQALRHPSFKFEVYDSGTGACSTTTEYSNDFLPTMVPPGSLDPRRDSGTYTYQFFGPVNFSVSLPPAKATLQEAVSSAINPDGTPMSLSPAIYGWNTDSGTNETLSPYDTTLGPPAFVDQNFFFMWFNPGVPTDLFTTVPDVSVESVCTFVSSKPTGFWWKGDVIGGTGFLVHLGHGIYNYPFAPGVGFTTCGGSYSIEFQPDIPIKVVRIPGIPPNPCANLLPAPIAGYCVGTDGKYIRAGTWVRDTSHTWKVLGRFTTNFGTGAITQYPISPALPDNHANYNNATFWTNAYNAAVIAGTVPAGQTYGVEYPQTQDHGWTIDMQICDGAGAGISVGEIIRRICARCSLVDVDASDMSAVFVDGYSVSTVSAGRDILTPLRSVGFFDCVESGLTLKFVARGKPVVATFTADDFGAFDSGANPTPGPSITTVKAQDADLPLQTRVHYLATSRDYEAGEQLSPTRLTTTAVNVVDVELAVCMSDTQAAKIADVIWADAWAERWSGTLAVDQAQSDLEPGDCIEVPVDGVSRRIRIINETLASGVLRTLNYVRDDDGAYVSHAVADAPIRQPQILKLLSATDLEFLDLPALTDADDNAGFYAAARGSTLAGNLWSGCAVFRSADGGATFAQLGSITTAATIGTLHVAITPSDWHTWDDVTTITVDVPTGVTFESRTDAAVLTGANSAAVGADGRWEIVQFANATQLSPTQWRLSRLLRGRRGTEHNISSSHIGDKFVMISTGALVRLPLQTSEIGANRIYKAVSIGASYASGIDQVFAGQGVALRPFSPVRLAAERDTAGDIVLTWTRRGRLGRTLMSGVDIPLSEAVESYSVDIFLPDSPHTVVRTIATGIPTAIYTAAQQSTDFGSDSAMHVMVAVYQISAIVGRGTPDVQTLTIT